MPGLYLYEFKTPASYLLVNPDTRDTVLFYASSVKNASYNFREFYTHAGYSVTDQEPVLVERRPW